MGHDFDVNVTDKDYVILPDKEGDENARIMLVREPWESIIFRYKQVKIGFDEKHNVFTCQFSVEILEPSEVAQAIESDGFPDELREYMGDIAMHVYAKHLEATNENRADNTVQPSS